MLNRKERLRLLETERRKQIQKIRNIECNMKELLDREESIRSQKDKEKLLQIEYQEEMLLNQVVRRLAILDEIDANIEVLCID